MTARYGNEHSPLFFRRFEQGAVILPSQRPRLEEILTSHGFCKQSTKYTTTTYFSRDPGGSIWQWQDQTKPDGLIVVRFRQRFETTPIKDGVFALEGGGDLEFKIHHSNSDSNTKLSIHISEEISIERLIALSHTDPYRFWVTLAELSIDTGENNINPLALVARVDDGLAPLVMRTANRETYTNGSNQSRVTIDSSNAYYGFPYWDNTEPVYSAAIVAERSDVLNVDIKAPVKTGQIAALIDEVNIIATGEPKAKSGKTYAQLREMALKRMRVIVKEQSTHEIEAKLQVEVTDHQLTLEDILNQIYACAATDMIPGFRISRQFPHIEARTAESALYRMYGWVDPVGNVHEAFTVIEAEGHPKTYWLKHKNDPETTTEKGSMKRKEKMEKYTERPDIDALTSRKTEELGHSVFKIADYRKHKIAFKVEEIATGRTFTVSLDEAHIENGKDIKPLRQVEIEYAETPAHKIDPALGEETIQKSCDALQRALAYLDLGNVALTPTRMRKIEWLYQQIYKQ